MRIARDGTWFYRGSPINRKPLVRLFSTVLRREDDGEYWLVTPAERGRILVEDAPFTAVEIMASGSGRDQVLRFRTNVEEEVTVDAEHPIRVARNAGADEPRPYVLVRPGLEALILRPVFYHLVELAETSPNNGGDQHGGADQHNDGDLLGVWSAGQFFPLEAAGPRAPAVARGQGEDA